MIGDATTKGRFYPFFPTNFRRKHQDALPPKSVGQKTSILMPASSFKDQFEATCLGKKPLDFENNRWYIRSSIAIKVDIYIVKSCLYSNFFVRPTMAFGINL